MCRMGLFAGNLNELEESAFLDWAEKMELRLGGHGNGMLIQFPHTKKKKKETGDFSSLYVSGEFMIYRTLGTVKEETENIKAALHLAKKYGAVSFAFHTRLASAGGRGLNNIHPAKYGGNILFQNGTVMLPDSFGWDTLSVLKVITGRDDAVNVLKDTRSVWFFFNGEQREWHVINSGGDLEHAEKNGLHAFVSSDGATFSKKHGELYKGAVWKISEAGVEEIEKGSPSYYSGTSWKGAYYD